MKKIKVNYVKNFIIFLIFNIFTMIFSRELNQKLSPILSPKKVSFINKKTAIISTIFLLVTIPLIWPAKKNLPTNKKLRPEEIEKLPEQEVMNLFETEEKQLNLIKELKEEDLNEKRKAYYEKRLTNKIYCLNAEQVLEIEKKCRIHIFLYFKLGTVPQEAILIYRKSKNEKNPLKITAEEFLTFPFIRNLPKESIEELLNTEAKQENMYKLIEKNKDTFAYMKMLEIEGRQLENIQWHNFSLFALLNFQVIENLLEKNLVTLFNSTEKQKAIEDIIKNKNKDKNPIDVKFIGNLDNLKRNQLIAIIEECKKQNCPIEATSSLVSCFNDHQKNYPDSIFK